MFIAIVLTATILAPPPNPEIVAHTLDSCMRINPQSGESHIVECPPTARRSPDGKWTATLSRSEDGSADFLLTDAQDSPSATTTPANMRRVTIGMAISEYAWSRDGSFIAFIGGPTQQAYRITTADPPIMSQISDDSGPCSLVITLPNGHIAWCVERGREGKARSIDLTRTCERDMADQPPLDVGPPLPPPSKLNSLVPPPPLAPETAPPPAPPPTPQALRTPTTPLLRSFHIMSLRLDDAGSILAVGVIGGLKLVDLDTRAVRSIDCMSIDPGLYAHFPSCLSWRPDGRILAATITFAGGRACALKEDGAQEEEMHMLGDAEIFFIPVDSNEAAWKVNAPRNITGLSWLSGSP